MSVIAVWFIAMLGGLAWFAFDDQGVFLFAGATACFILSLPLATRRPYDLLSPWSLVLMGAYLGYGIRGLFISMGINGTRTLEELYYLGQPPAYFVWPSTLFVAGIATFTVGYLLGSHYRHTGDRPPIGGLTMSPGRVYIAVLVCALLGFIAFWLFAQSTGGISLGRLSAKRTLINSGAGLSASYESHGGLRFANYLSSVALWIQLAWFAHRGVRMAPWRPGGIWLGVLFINASLLPMFASTRSDVVMMIVTSLAILMCIKGRALKVTTLLAGGLVAVAIVSFLTTARMNDQGNANAQLGTKTLVDAFVLTRTFADIPTSAHIIRAVPEALPYSNGETIAQWIIAPIPRSLWPEKPIISSGPEIAIAIYGNDKTGVPPGLFAESYWNFGWGGLLILPMMSGGAIAMFFRLFAPWARSSPGAAVALAALALRPGIDLTTNGIGYAAFQMISGLFLLLPVLWFCGSNRDPEAKLTIRRAGPSLARSSEIDSLSVRHRTSV